MVLNAQEENVIRPRLIAAGTRLFGDLDGHEVSNRMLAHEAGVTHALINYHFGGRDGLCQAIYEHCLEQWKKIMLPIVDHASQRLEDGCGPLRLSRTVHELIHGMVRAITGKEGSQLLAVLLNEGLLKPKQFHRRMFQDVINPFHAMATRLASLSRGLPEDDLESVVLGQTIVAQCMTFFRGRLLLLPRLHWDDFDSDRAGRIADILSCSIRASLGLPNIPAN